MTIEERIKKNDERIEEMKDYVRKCECGYYHDNRTCEAARHWIEDFEQRNKWLEELQAHRYAWAKLREDIRDEAEFAYADFDKYKYEVLGIDDVDDLPNDDYRYGMERALELVDIYRPKEGDAE